MKSKRTKVLVMASLVMCLLALVASAARGDSGGVDLTLSGVSGAPGSEVTVYGTITNTGSDDVYLNSENFTLGSTYFSNGDVTDFFLNAPLSLGPDSNSGLIALFTFDVASGTPGGAMGATFSTSWVVAQPIRTYWPAPHFQSLSRTPSRQSRGR